MNGFYAASQFRCRELAIYDRKEGMKISNHFYIGEFHNLSETDKKLATFSHHHVHGLKFTNIPMKNQKVSRPQDNLKELLKCIANEKNALIAFKGKNIDKSLFDLYGIKNVIDIEIWGCPTLDVLIKEYGDEQVRYKYFDCGEHEPLKNGDIAYCPGVETYYNNIWLDSVFGVYGK